MNGITVFLGLSKGFQKHHRAPFAPHVPVRFFVKNAAGTGFREHVRFGESHEAHGGQQNIHAPRDRSRDFAVRHRPARHIQCHQRRRTRGIHRH